MLSISDLATYHIDPVTGFVPAVDPLPRLPAYFEPWEQIVGQMSDLLLTGRLRAAVAGLPQLNLDRLEDEPARQRAMLLLSVLGNGYVWAEAEAAAELPAAVAVPWTNLAATLGRLPVAAHQSMVLNNWRRIDPTQPVQLGNVAALATFFGGPDEQWFYLVTLQIELDGAPALPALLRVQAAVAAEQPDMVVEELGIIAAAIARMLATLERMPEKCDPYIFYHRVRPFFSSWPQPGLIYAGVSPEPRVLAGGSAAQSSLVQALDAGLGVAHDSERTGPFLRQMRAYMPRPHRDFLSALAAGPALRPFVARQAADRPALAAAYDACLAQLDAFRRKHIEISVRYIVHQAPDREDAVGTGGTSFVPFLSEARKETQRQQIGPAGDV